MALPVALPANTSYILGPWRPAFHAVDMSGIGTPDTGNSLGKTTGNAAYQCGAWQPSSAATIQKITVYLSKAGSPTDNIVCKIYDANGTLKATSLPISGASLTGSATLQTFTFPSPVPLETYAFTNATSYAYKIERTGSLDDTNYYWCYYKISELVTWYRAYGDGGDAVYIAGIPTGATSVAVWRLGDPANDSSFTKIAENTGATALTTINGKIDDATRTLHIGVCDGTGTSMSMKYCRFNFTTCTFDIGWETVTSGLNVTSTAMGAVSALDVMYRPSDGQPVMFINGARRQVSSTYYSQILYCRRTGTNTWSAATAVDAAGNYDYAFPSVAMGASNSLHCLYQRGPGLNPFYLVQRTLNSSNALQTVSTALSTALAGATVYGYAGSYSYDGGTSWRVFYAFTSSTVNGAIGFNSANTPSLGSIRTTQSSTSQPYQWFYDTVKKTSGHPRTSLIARGTTNANALSAYTDTGVTANLSAGSTINNTSNLFSAANIQYLPRTPQYGYPRGNNWVFGYHYNTANYTEYNVYSHHARNALTIAGGAASLSGASLAINLPAATDFAPTQNPDIGLGTPDLIVNVNLAATDLACGGAAGDPVAAFDVTATGQTGGGDANLNFRSWIRNTLLADVPGATQARVTFSFGSSSSAGQIDGLYFGHEGANAGTQFEFDGTQVHVPFGGSYPFNSTSGASSVTSDWFDFTWDHSVGIVYAWHMNSSTGGGPSLAIYDYGSAGYVETAWASGADTSADTASAMAVNVNQSFGITKIEVRTSGAGTGIGAPTLTENAAAPVSLATDGEATAAAGFTLPVFSATSLLGTPAGIASAAAGIDAPSLSQKAALSAKTIGDITYLVSNGDFSLDPINASPDTVQNGWAWHTAGGGSVAYSGGTVRATSDGSNDAYIYASFATTPGNQFTVSWEWGRDSGTAGGWYRICNGADGSGNITSGTTPLNGNFTFSNAYTATASTTYVQIGATHLLASTVIIDNVKVWNTGDAGGLKAAFDKPTLTVNVGIDALAAATSIASAAAVFDRPALTQVHALATVGIASAAYGDTHPALGQVLVATEIFAWANPTGFSNGDFSANPINASAQTLQNGWQWKIAGGTSTVTYDAGNTRVALNPDGANLAQFGTGALSGLTIGKVYEVHYDVIGNAVTPYIGTAAFGQNLSPRPASLPYTGTQLHIEFTATATTHYVTFNRQSAGTAYVDNVSVHAALASMSLPALGKVLATAGLATQASTPATPTLQARSNLTAQGVGTKPNMLTNSDLSLSPVSGSMDTGLNGWAWTSYGSPSAPTWDGDHVTMAGDGAFGTTFYALPLPSVLAGVTYTFTADLWGSGTAALSGGTSLDDSGLGTSGSITLTGSPTTYTATLNPADSISAAIMVLVGATGTVTIDNLKLSRADATNALTVGFGYPAFTAFAAGIALPDATPIASAAASLGAPALTQVHGLATTGIASQAIGFTLPTFAQKNALATTGIASAASTTATPTIMQRHVLATSGIATAASTAATPAFAAKSALGTPTGIATAASTPATPALTQRHVLTGTAISTVAAGFTLPAVAATSSLGTPAAIASAAAGFTLPALSQGHVLASTGIASQASPAALPALTQKHVLGATGIASQPAVVPNATATTTNALGNPAGIAGAAAGWTLPALGQKHTLATNGLSTAASGVPSAPLSQRHVLAATPLATQASTPATTALGQVLGTAGIASAAAGVGTPALGQVVSATALAGQAASLGAPSLNQKHVLAGTALGTAAAGLGTPAIAQTNALGTPAGLATQAAGFTLPAVSQKHVLAGGLATVASTPATPTLSSNYKLGTPAGIATAAAGFANNKPTLKPTNILGTPVFASAAASLGTPAFNQKQALATTGLATQAAAMGRPAMSGLTVMPAATAIASQSPSLGRPALTQLHRFTTSDIVVQPAAVGTSAFNQRQSLGTDGIAVSAALDLPAFAQAQFFNADPIVLPVAIDEPPLKQWSNKADDLVLEVRVGVPWFMIGRFEPPPRFRGGSTKASFEGQKTQTEFKGSTSDTDFRGIT